MNKRQHYKSEFKKEVAIEALKERKTLQEIALEYAVAPSLNTFYAVLTTLILKCKVDSSMIKRGRLYLSKHLVCSTA
ncbi:MAG: hypothetical protein NTX05_05975 [Fusobacteria bacterium]|nr:hypothetical protein [Fusobacteriota bacterium]